MDEALVGNIQPISVPLVTKEEEQEFTEDDLKWAAIGNSPDWEVITAYLDERIQHYVDDLAGVDLAGADLSKVGERFLVCNLVATELKGLRAKVDITTEAVRAERRSS